MAEERDPVIDKVFPMVWHRYFDHKMSPQELDADCWGFLQGMLAVYDNIEAHAEAEAVRHMLNIVDDRGALALIDGDGTGAPA